MSYTLLLSGHKRSKTQLQSALGEAGFVPLLLNEGEDHWGFSSYTDPVTANAAGQPNAGHTPGTAHPEVLEHIIVEGDHKHCEECPHVGQTEHRLHKSKHIGEPYEPDPRIGFVTVVHDNPRSIDQAQDIADKYAWSLRSHWETAIPPEPNAVQNALAKLQQQIDALTAQLKGGV